MCQLFGINASGPMSPQDYLRGFFCRGGGTSDHKDGWGLAYHSQGSALLNVRTSSAHDCTLARSLLQQLPNSNSLVAHIRKATMGAVELRNSHPFRRRLWGYDWVFAHNGDLKTFHREHGGRYTPVGDTDSEAAFCHLLNALVDRFGEFEQPPFATVRETLRQESRKIAKHGTFNFLLMVGDLLITYGTTDLYWLELDKTIPRSQLVDVDQAWVDHHRVLQGNERAIVVATHPLTDDPRWQRYDANDMKVFAHGLMVEEASTSEDTQHAVPDKNSKAA